MMDDLLEVVKQRKVSVSVEDIAGKILKTCQVCQEKFTLVEYISHSHPKILPESLPATTVLNESRPGDLSCSVCRESFPKESLLRIHQVQKHSSSLVACLTKATLPVNCGIVRKIVWGSPSGNVKRPRLHTFKRFKCQHCDKRFVLQSQCKSHENAHAETPVSLSPEQESSIDYAVSESSVLESSHSEEAQVEIITNGFHSESDETVTPASSGTETASQIPSTGSDCGEMEGPSTSNSGTPPVPTMMEMPKLVAPTQVHRLSDFTKFQGGQNRTLFVTSVSSLPAPVNSDSEVPFDPSMVNGMIKNQVHVGSLPTATVTNGDTFPRQCDEKAHKCLSCDVMFPESQLFPHIKTHLKKGQKECSLCAYKAIASGDLRDHMNKHYNIKPYKCPVCPNSYVWQSGWKKHVETHSKGEKSFKCNQCKLRFDSQRERRRHELVHKNITGPSPPKKQRKGSPRPKVPPASSPPNPDASTASNPQQEFHGGDAGQQHPQYQYTSQAHNNYTVPVYPSENFTHQASYYDGNGNMQQQQQYTSYNNTNHTYAPGLGQAQENYGVGAYANQGNPLQAQNPNWNQQAGEYYKGSKNTGEGDQLEKKSEAEQFLEPDDPRESETCKTCGVEIGMMELAVHIRSHILPGQKSCTICKYKCNTKSYLEEHYNIHYGLKPFTCPICKRKFAMRSYLRSHTLQVHENESTRRFQCRYCNKRFVRACHLRTHEKIHEGQGEVLPPGESSFVNPGMDSSDSNSNSNASFRLPMTPERKSSTASTSSQSTHTVYPHHSRSNSPQVSTPVTAVKSEPQWNGGTPPATTQTTPTQWPYWNGGSGSGYTPQGLQGCGYHDNTTWSNPYYYPLVKSDVNWTEPLAETWQGQLHSQSHHGYSPQVKMDSSSQWAESPSNGFHQASNPAAPPSASVQDLWAELHYEEMKWLPETSTVYTADGIPMITELAPFDGFSYTEMLNNAAADLPLFGTSDAPSAFQPSSSTLEVTGGQEVKPPAEYSSQGGAVPNGKTTATTEPLPPPRPPPRNNKGRGKGKLTAEAKHKLKLSFAKRLPDTELELSESLSSSPKTWEGSEDEGEPADLDSMMQCKTCKQDVIRRDLLEHIRGHIVPGQRTCDICQRTYCNTLTLKEHIHVHYKLKPYQCSFCEERFSTKYSLKTHETFSHEEGKASIVECPYPSCGKQYAMRSELHKHIKIHANKNGTSASASSRQPQIPAKATGRKRPTSGSSAKAKEELIKDASSRRKVWEVRLEDIGRKLTKKCPFCKEEILVADFYEHKYNHKEPCHICEKPIPVAEILFHGPTHVSERICDVCGWTAKQRSQIWEHMNSHLKVKPILCLYCGQRFTSRNTLRTHYLVTHTSFRPHSCRYCEKTFVQYNTMRAHEFTHLGNQCPACPEKFSKRKDLESHLREVHKYVY